MNHLLKDSEDIFTKTAAKFDPYSVVLAFSGGSDSLTAYYVIKELGLPIDFIIHANTRTGIKETTEYVRRFSKSTGIPYLEYDADTAYEDYVLRKGFFGRGKRAHSYAYHILKATGVRSLISKNIRKRKRNRPVLILNGARAEESDNRKNNFTEIHNRDPASKGNIWTNIIHNWTKDDCLDFLDGCKAEINPVTSLLHRSGECMCGTMQSDEDRREASLWFPEWGKWVDNLEQRVWDNGFCWKWGEHVSARHIEKQNGQLDMFDDFQPMCIGCKHQSKPASSPKPSK